LCIFKQKGPTFVGPLVFYTLGSLEQFLVTVLPKLDPEARSYRDGY